MDGAHALDMQCRLSGADGRYMLIVGIYESVMHGSTCLSASYTDLARTVVSQ